MPVIADGFVSGAAAMLAIEMAPLCSEYLFFSIFLLKRDTGLRLIGEKRAFLHEICG